MKVSLVTRITFLTLSLSIMASIVLFLLSINQLKENLIEEETNNLENTLYNLQINLQYFYQNQNINQVQTIFSTLYSNENIISAYFFGEHDKVIASTKPSDIGKKASNLTIFKEQTRDYNSYKNMIWVSDDQLSLHGFSPIFILPATPMSTLKRTQNQGGVYIHKSISGNLQKKEHLLYSSFLITLFLLVCFGLYISYYVYIIIGKRINKINQVAKEVSNLNYDINLPETLPDEIGSLYNQFNLMTNTLKEQENSISEQHRNLNEIQKSSHIGTWEYNIKENKIFWSDEVYRIFSIPQTTPLTIELISKNVSEEHVSILRNIYNPTYKIDQQQETKYSIIVNNRTKHILQQCLSKLNKYNEVVCKFGFIQDITEQINFENKISNDANKFLKWKESNFIGIIQSSEKGDIYDANDSMLNMIGYTKKDLAENMINWANITPPEYTHLDLSAIKEASVKGYWTPFEKEYLHKNGHRVSVIIGGSIYKTNPNEYIVFILDISESKKRENENNLLISTLEKNKISLEKSYSKIVNSEKSQSEILNFLLDAVIVINQDGIILSINKATLSLFEYTETELIGKNINILMPEPFKGHHDQYLKNYLKTGKMKIIGKGREVQAIRKNNKTMPIRLSVAELPSSADGQRRFIGSCIDITHEKHQQKEVKRTQKLVALGNLTGGIAHDFNNLLAIINGYSELLSDELDSHDEMQGYLNEIIKAGERGKNLTSKLLNFSTSESSDNKASNICTLVSDNQKSYQNILTTNIHLSLKLPDKIWLVLFPPADFLDVVLNMTINARHAITGKGEFQIEACNQVVAKEVAHNLNLKEGEYVKLILSDTGKGMDEQTQEQIFDPFFTTKGDGGTGLGMSQVYGFTQRVGAHIRINSTLMKGTCISIYFPRHQDNQELEEQTLSTLEVKSYQPQYTILVVDDELALSQLATHVLQLEGYQTLQANCAEQALQIVANHPVDLILSDVIMGGMNGYELYREVKTHYSSIKFLLASGFNEETKIDQEEEALQKNILRKPYLKIDLIQRVAQLLSE